MAKISVIIPVYNVEKYIRECLDSVVNQTFKDIEIICIDDGSTDKSLDILREYEEKDSRFKIIIQENQGQGIARNKAIDIAQGEYTVFVDPDDWFELDALEKIYKYFKETNANVIQFNYKEYIEQSSKYKKNNFQKTLLKKYHYNIAKTKTYNLINLGKNCFLEIGLAVWTRAYSTSYLKSNNIKCAPNKQGEDNIFSFMALLCTENIHYLDEYLYIYRVRIGSARNKASLENFCVFENIKLIEDFLIKKNLFNILEKEYRTYIQKILICHYHCIPFENQEEYKTRASRILTTTEYNTFLKKLKNNNSLGENIFSIKNKKICGIKHKCITIFGITFSFKIQKKKAK